MVFLFAIAFPLLVVPTLGMNFAPQGFSGIQSNVGVMSKSGVTRYSHEAIKTTKRTGGFWWPNGNQRHVEGVVGASDLTDNVSWGWHHPNGFFNSIPVGSPLIDGDMNIILGSDDAVRKFSVDGTLLWTYAPRGQLAAAPTLANSSVRRAVNPAGRSMDSSMYEQQVEDGLKPSWLGGASGDTSAEAMKDIAEGDILKVRTGMGYSAEGKEFYAAGDLGEITKIIKEGDKHTAYILWKRTGHRSVASTANLHQRFTKINRAMTTTATDMLVGSTTSGFVFAIDLVTGEEVWVTQVCAEIAGVKGAVTVKDGVILVATNRCVDRYCYRHRSLINPLWPSNSIITALDLADGSVKWTFKPRSPVWNFLPEYKDEDAGGSTVLFQDIEGSAYALDVATGTEKWRHYGYMGTYCQGHLVFSPYHDVAFVMLVKEYDEGNGYEADKACNAFRIQGIHVNCDTWPNRAGVIWALNASSGSFLYGSADLPEPPASGVFGKLDSHIAKHARLVVTVGHNCHYQSATWMYAFNPDTLRTAWWKEGPTLWSYYCAGDKEGGDIRRALGQRAKCEPGSWSVPVIDSIGNIFVGNQVGQLQLWAASGLPRRIKLASTLSTGVAFQDQAIALAPGIMAVSTCSSLIVFRTNNYYDTFKNGTWETDLVDSLPYEVDERPFGVDGPANAGTPTQHTDGVYYRPYNVNPPPAL